MSIGPFVARVFLLYGIIAQEARAEVNMSNSKTRYEQVKGGMFRKAVCRVALLAITALGMLLPGTIAGQAGTPPQEPAQKTKPAPTASPAGTQPRPAPAAAEVETWRQTMLHTQRPKRSCYQANYPDTAWTEVTCIKPPTVPQSLGTEPGPNPVGQNVDDSAGSEYISQSDGSFTSATGVTSECEVQCPGLICPTKPSCNGQPSNAFSLQMNTQYFDTQTCRRLKAPDSGCQAEVQFVFSNTQCGMAEPQLGAKACIYIQYWMWSYGVTKENTTVCPKGWTPSGQGNCFINSNGTPVPQQVVSNAELESLKLTGRPGFQVPGKQTAQNGVIGEQPAQNGAIGEHYDTVTLAIGSTVYTASGDDIFPEFGNSWSTSEFNIFGDCCQSQAVFNAGTTLKVQTLIDGAAGGAPACSAFGNTLESNNLQLVAKAGTCASFDGTSRGIDFTEALPGTSKGSIVVLYNPDAGQGDVVGFEGAGEQIMDVRQSGWRTTWDKAVVGDFTGEKLGKEMAEQVLLYDRTAGQADVVGFDNNGNENLDAQNPGFGKSWDKIVAGDFLGIGQQQVLLYDHNAGQLALVAFNSNGVASKPVLNNGFSTSYDEMVAGYFTNDKRQQVVLYDRNAGRLDVVAFDAKGGVSMGIPNQGLSTSYDKVVAGYFLGDEREQVVLYDPSAGRLDLVAFDSKGGVSMDTPNKGFRASYDKIVAGYFTGEMRRYGLRLQMVQQMLLYDRTAGEADVVAFDTKGYESLDAPNKGFRTSWDKIVVGDFLGNGNGQEQVVLYDPSVGRLDLVAFDSKGGVSLGAQNSGYRGSKDLLAAGAFTGK
jgi:hypothetical protein